MNIKLFVFFLTIVGCTIAAREQTVLDLTDADFLTRLTDKDTNLVMFYAPT